MSNQIKTVGDLIKELSNYSEFAPVRILDPRKFDNDGGDAGDAINEISSIVDMEIYEEDEDGRESENYECVTIQFVSADYVETGAFSQELVGRVLRQEFDDMNIYSSDGTCGLSDIIKERLEQIVKHNRPVLHDLKYNNEGQMQHAAVTLLMHELDSDFIVSEELPKGWAEEIFLRMNRKSRKERLIIAGALIAAEIDLINLEASGKVKKGAWNM